MKKAVDCCPRLSNTLIIGKDDQQAAGRHAAFRAATLIARTAAIAKVIVSMVRFNII